MKRPHPLPLKTCFLIPAMMFLLFSSACSMMQKDHEDDYENLNRIMKLYNNEFESKSDRAGAMWVKHDMKSDYLIQAKEVFSRINFVDSQVLNVVFKKSGKMVQNNGGAPGNDFDEALVLIRYEYVLSPSVSVKTKMVKQRWIMLPDGAWNLVPDLTVFLN